MEFFKTFTALQLGLPFWSVLVLDAILVVAMLTCALTDARTGKILNKVTFPTMLAGLLLNGAFGLVSGIGAQGLLLSLLGLAVGFGIQFLPWVLGLAKAGDVKLLMAAGALKGWAFCLFGFLYGAVAFGILSLSWLLRNGELRKVGANLKNYLQIAVVTQSAPDAPTPTVTKRFVPWGVGLASGFLFALVLELILGKPFWFQL